MDLEEEGLYCLSSENKGADAAQLICVFVLAYAKIWFSCDTAQWFTVVRREPITLSNTDGFFLIKSQYHSVLVGIDNG